MQMRVVLILLSLGILAALAADNIAYEVTAQGAKKVDLSAPEMNYFGNTARSKRSVSSVLKTNSLTWELVYEDKVQNTNVGFDDPVLGPKATAALNSVLEEIGNALGSYTQTVKVLVKASNTLPKGVAAQAGTYYSTATSGFRLGAFQTKVTTGENMFQESVGHGFITYTFDGIDWWFNNSIPSGVIYDYDFTTVSMHELTHMLGFISLTNSDGTSAIANNVRSVYDSLLETGSGQALYSNTGAFTAPVGALTGKSNGLVIAVGGKKYPIYAPSPFQSGSSLSHWDPEKEYMLMNPAVSPCMIIRGWSDAEIAVLQATGYDLIATPYTAPDTSNCVNGFDRNSGANTNAQLSFAVMIAASLFVVYA